jgi:hypothetical protein
MGTTNKTIFAKRGFIFAHRRRRSQSKRTLARSFPPVLPDNPSAAKRTEFRTWWKDDARAMLIIERRITQVQLGLLPSTPDTTARDCWKKIRELYGRLDVHAQFALMDKVSALCLEDHNDCDRYLSEFSLARAQFAKMGVKYTELQAVHALIKGLPNHGPWVSFTQITNTYVGEWVRSEARKDPANREVDNALWENLVSRLTQECLHLSTIANKSQSSKNNGPGSEYAGYSSNIIIRKSKQNPNGVKCTNCNGISHDVNHCFAPNGGMAGMGEAFQSKTRQFAQLDKKSDPVVAAFSSEINTQDLSVESNRPASDYSFVSFENVLTPDKFPSVVNTYISTLLDSGASSHIIKDARYFWNYDRQGAKSVRTANHGTLPVLGSGDCVAIVRYGNLSTRLTLRNCLHAPSAVVNLLSVGKIVSAGLGCNFENNNAIISAPRPDKRTLCKGTMVNNLFFLDIEYLAAPPNHNAQISRSRHSLMKLHTDDLLTASTEITQPIITTTPASSPQICTQSK